MALSTLFKGISARLKRAYRPGFDPRFSRLSEAGAKGPLIKKKVFGQHRFPLKSGSLRGVYHRKDSPHNAIDIIANCIMRRTNYVEQEMKTGITR
jgi:hypothetical protein